MPGINIELSTLPSPSLCTSTPRVNVPVFDVGGANLHHKDYLKYMGMIFYRTLNMAKSAEHASRPFLASAYRICA